MANYFAALKAKDKEEAERFLTALIAEAQKENPLLNYAEARAIQLENLGYTLGYLSEEGIYHALAVYPEAEHPILGREFNDLPTSLLFKVGLVCAAKGREAAKALVEEYRKNRG